MNHPLDGARLKASRAQEHLEALRLEIGRYLDTRPYEVPVEEKGGMVNVGPVTIKAEPPPRLSCILGDCVGSLRASLDYVAWQLGTKRLARPLREREERRIAFPITTAQV